MFGLFSFVVNVFLVFLDFYFQLFVWEGVILFVVREGVVFEDVIFRQIFVLSFFRFWFGRIISDRFFIMQSDIEDLRFQIRVLRCLGIFLIEIRKRRIGERIFFNFVSVKRREGMYQLRVFCFVVKINKVNKLRFLFSECFRLVGRKY